MPTVDDCKRLLFKLGIKHGISPRLISERLLSKEDKVDMLAGYITFDCLDESVFIWKDTGMRDYATGNGDRYNLYPINNTKE